MVQPRVLSVPWGFRHHTHKYRPRSLLISRGTCLLPFQNEPVLIPTSSSIRDPRSHVGYGNSSRYSAVGVSRTQMRCGSVASLKTSLTRQPPPHIAGVLKCSRSFFVGIFLEVERRRSLQVSIPRSLSIPPFRRLSSAVAHS